MIGLFPGLQSVRWQLTSDEDPRYNCHAYALGETQIFIDPNPELAAYPGIYWPRRVQRAPTLEAFTDLYGAEGYVECVDGSLEPGFEKLAIYVSTDGVEHTARQMLNGSWSSKIGYDEDIMHETPAALEGTTYGRVARYMKRRRRPLKTRS